MFGLKGVLLLVFAVDQVLSRDTDYCYAYDDNPYLKFATKTAYHFVHGGRTPYEPIPHCKPVQIWMMIRHGTRYPERDVIGRMNTLANLRDTIIDNHELRGHGHLCDADLDNLRMWRLDPTVQVEVAEELTGQGFEEMYQLGKRIRTNFPELFPPIILSNVSSANYKFRSSISDRPGEAMASSKKALMSGIFDRVDIPDAEIPQNDILFASYFNCAARTKVINSPDYLIEITRFAEGPEYQNLILNVSRRLGFPNNMTVGSIHDMWDMCRYDKAWNITALSPWCAVFSEKELMVLEYRDDLVDYYNRGYGNEYNIRLGYPPLQHLFRHFEKLEKDDYSNEPKGIFNVGGSRSVHHLVAALGISKDPTHLLASDFLPMNKYGWRTSELGGFGGNIAAVFYKCNGTGSPNKVIFYQAENILPYEGCDGGLCDWEYLKNKFPNATLDFNFDFCHQNSSIIN